jgi:hypothetical protein
VHVSLKINQLACAPAHLWTTGLHVLGVQEVAPHVPLGPRIWLPLDDHNTHTGWGMWHACHSKCNLTVMRHTTIAADNTWARIGAVLAMGSGGMKATAGKLSDVLPPSLTNLMLVCEQHHLQSDMQLC